MIGCPQCGELLRTQVAFDLHLAEYHRLGDEPARPISIGRQPGRPFREALRRIFVAPFAWRDVRDQGVWLYQQNAVTGARRAVRISRCGQPIDFAWIAAGEADGFVVDRDGTSRVPRGSVAPRPLFPKSSEIPPTSFETRTGRSPASTKEAPMAEAIHPAPAEFSAEQIGQDHILRYFHYAHLPAALQAASKPFCDLARMIVETLPRNPERTVALRKLLEAKDAAVRANVPPTRCETVEVAKAVDVALDGGAIRGVAAATKAILTEVEAPLQSIGGMVGPFSAFQSEIEPGRWYVGNGLVAYFATEIGASGGQQAHFVAALLNECLAEPEHEDADPVAAPSGGYWRVAEALSRSPAIEALVPSNDEWTACESVQDTYDLMKRKLRRAIGAALNAGL